MEDGNSWEEIYERAGEANTLLLLPNPYLTNRTLLHPLAQSGSPQSSDLTEANLERKVSDSDASGDRAKKKRMIDKAYRERMKEVKMNAQMKLDMLTKENDHLKRENDFFKKEEARLKQTLRSQEEEMKQLKKEFGQLKGELDRQNTVVEVLSNRLAGSKDSDLQHENTQLKHRIDLLRKKMNNPDNLNIIQLQEKNAQLEHEKSALQVIIDALCEKINDEKDCEQEKA